MLIHTYQLNPCMREIQVAVFSHQAYCPLCMGTKLLVWCLKYCSSGEAKLNWQRSNNQEGSHMSKREQKKLIKYIFWVELMLFHHVCIMFQFLYSCCIMESDTAALGCPKLWYCIAQKIKEIMHFLQKSRSKRDIKHFCCCTLPNHISVSALPRIYQY